MESNKITCPYCDKEISIDNVLSRRIEERVKLDFDAKQKEMERELETKRADLEKAEKDLVEKQKMIDVEVAAKVAANLDNERIGLIKKIKIQVESEKSGEIKLLEEGIKEKEERIEKFAKKEIELRKEKNRIEDEKKNFELEKLRQLDEERKKIEEIASKKASEEQQYIIAQLKKQLSDATKVKDDLARKLEQGSQQTQGEVLELELEEILKEVFPFDQILPVPKGICGADLMQGVMNNNGRLCGNIIWESKKTKAWADSWIGKLRDDQRAAKAEIAIIVSSTLPQDIKTFDFRNGVWICGKDFVVPLATALRMNLEAIYREKSLSEGKNEKMEIIYKYLTGTEFRQRVEAIVEAFSTMKEEIGKEKLAYTKIWTQREKQIDKVLHNTVGMYGDLSGMVALPSIKNMELPEGKNKKK